MRDAGPRSWRGAGSQNGLTGSLTDRDSRRYGRYCREESKQSLLGLSSMRVMMREKRRQQKDTMVVILSSWSGHELPRPEVREGRETHRLRLDSLHLSFARSLTFLLPPAGK